MAQNSETAHLFQLGEFLDSQRQAATMTDVVLVCDGRDFPAHKMILSATSNYFRAMFSPGWDESKHSRIELPYVGAEEMDIILPFLYTGKFKDVEDQPFLKALLAASHSLQINALFKCCYKKLSKRLSDNSFLDICNLAFQFDDEGMIMDVLTFLAQHFGNVAKSEEFLKLSANLMQKFSQHPDTLKCSMDTIINGLFRWTEVDEQREKTPLEILTTLDLQRLSTNFLSETLRQQALVKKNFHVLSLLTAEATSRLLISSCNNLEKANEPKLLTFGTNGERQVCRMYDIKQNQWLSPKTLPFDLVTMAGMSVVWFDGYVYVFGGKVNYKTEVSAKVIKYCPATNTIISFGKLAVPINQAGTGMLYESIYIVNGLNEKNQYVTTVQRYKPVTSTCEMVAPTNNPHNLPHVLPFEKYLIVCGSYKGENSVERYDPECDSWTSITAIPGAIGWCSAAIYNEKLFVVPTGLIPEFQIYDLSSNTWEQQQFEGCPTKIYDLYPIKFDGQCILLVRDHKSVLHSFDLEAKQWISKSTADIEPWSIWQSCVV